MHTEALEMDSESGRRKHRAGEIPASADAQHRSVSAKLDCGVVFADRKGRVGGVSVGVDVPRNAVAWSHGPGGQHPGVRSKERSSATSPSETQKRHASFGAREPLVGHVTPNGFLAPPYPRVSHAPFRRQAPASLGG